MIQPTSSNNIDEEQGLSGSPVNQQSSSAHIGSNTLNQQVTGEVPSSDVGVQPEEEDLTEDELLKLKEGMDAFDKQNSPEDILYENLTTEGGLTKTQALNKIVNQATYTDVGEPVDYEIAEKLRIKHNVPVYPNAKEATEDLDLGSEALFYVEPPITELSPMPNGIFMNTPKRAPNAKEVEEQVKRIFREIGADMTPVVSEAIAAYLETPGVAAIDAIHGLAAIPFFADTYIPTTGTSARLAGDLGWRIITAIPSMLMGKDYYDPLFGGVD